LNVDGRRVTWEELLSVVARIRKELRQQGLPDFEKTNKVPDG
jgi:hypothetical protein